MDTNKVLIVAMAAILIIAAVIIGFVAVDNGLEQIHPAGLMTGPEPIHPVGMEAPGAVDIPMDEMIYISAYPDDECAPSDRVLIDTPIRVVDPDGTVYWHWFYENGSSQRGTDNYISE